MKILIYLIRTNGGVGRVISELKPFFEKEGHELEIISREDDLKCNSTINAFRKIRKVVKRKNFDILFTQDWSCALLFLFYKRKNHFCFFHGHSLGLTFWFQYFVGKIIGKNLITADLKNQKIFKCHLAVNGVNIGDFKPLKMKKEYLGWINKTTEIIKKEDLIKIGNNLGMKVLIAEKISPDKMNEFYNKLKIFLSLPPKQAGCQLSYMEAMAAGVPKIIGNYNGEGFKYPFEKIRDFKDIENVIKNSKERDYRRFIIENNLNWEKQAEDIINLFNKNMIRRIKR